MSLTWRRHKAWVLSLHTSNLFMYQAECFKSDDRNKEELKIWRELMKLSYIRIGCDRMPLPCKC